MARMRAPCLGLLLVSLATPAFADTIILADGQEISGVVRERGDQVEVQLDFGTVSFPRAEVLEIRRQGTVLHEAEKRHARLSASDISGRMELARWCTAKGLQSKARALYQEVLALSPDNADAHRRLGHQQHEGRWLSESEYLQATGHVRFGGQWMTKEEAAQREDQIRENREARAQDRIARLEQKVAELESDQREPPPQDVGWNMWTNSGWWFPYRTYSQSFARGGFPVPFYVNYRYRGVNVGLGVPANNRRLNRNRGISRRPAARRRANARGGIGGRRRR